jgi:hypothetical protein
MISVIGAAPYERAETPRVTPTALADYSGACSPSGKRLREQLKIQLCAGSQHDESLDATEEFS